MIDRGSSLGQDMGGLRVTFCPASGEGGSSLVLAPLFEAGTILADTKDSEPNCILALAMLFAGYRARAPPTWFSLISLLIPSPCLGVAVLYDLCLPTR